MGQDGLVTSKSNASPIKDRVQPRNSKNERCPTQPWHGRRHAVFPARIAREKEDMDEPHHVEAPVGTSAMAVTDKRKQHGSLEADQMGCKRLLNHTRICHGFQEMHEDTCLPGV